MNYSARYTELTSEIKKLEEELDAMFLPAIFNRARFKELNSGIEKLYLEREKYFNDVFVNLKTSP